jgi:hypothetical protein
MHKLGLWITRKQANTGADPHAGWCGTGEKNPRFVGVRAGNLEKIANVSPPV